MITVETRPERLKAVQWHKPGDGTELGVQQYRLGKELRYGLPTMSCMQPITPGDWIVVGTSGGARVYSPGEFNHRFNIIEEDQA